MNLKIYKSPKTFIAISLLITIVLIGCDKAVAVSQDKMKYGPVNEDALKYTYEAPFMTTADMRVYFDDTEGIVYGGDVATLVTFFYPNVENVLLGDTPLPVIRRGRNLIEVKLPAGEQRVKLSTSKTTCTTPWGSGGGVMVDNAEDFRKAAGELKPGDELVIKNGIYTDWGRLRVSASG